MNQPETRLATVVWTTVDAYIVEKNVNHYDVKFYIYLGHKTVCRSRSKDIVRHLFAAHGLENTKA